jgi:hypothetical protein
MDVIVDYAVDVLDYAIIVELAVDEPALRFVFLPLLFQMKPSMPTTLLSVLLLLFLLLLLLVLIILSLLSKFSMYYLILLLLK